MVAGGTIAAVMYTCGVGMFKGWGVSPSVCVCVLACTIADVSVVGMGMVGPGPNGTGET